ncbi:unnamed protein product [Leptosia nina]|uniref:CS domain-containing protein n=1 Tax=Leptosia nina TaxID=320188 RepID=A0AAV1JEV7_9NEOP
MDSKIEKYDQMLISVLEEEKSIIGFLSAIFGFLARRTDFYYVPDGKYENMGFPPGVAEELVIKVLRKCDPKSWQPSQCEQAELSNEIMCSTVAQEVEVIDEQDSELSIDCSKDDIIKEISSSDSTINQTASKKHIIPEDYEPPIIPSQDSESYNGAVREKYTWSQTITDLNAFIKLPSHIQSAKELKVTINSGDISVANGQNFIIRDSFPFKIKTIDSVWSYSNGSLMIHLEKVQERWWDRLLQNEEPIDLGKIDCSRPLNELPEDHIAKVRELQWNQEQKMKGLPTSDEIRNIEILKKAWNMPGSPFKGKEFNPNVLYKP